MTTVYWSKAVLSDQTVQYCHFYCTILFRGKLSGLQDFNVVVLTYFILGSIFLKTLYIMTFCGRLYHMVCQMQRWVNLNMLLSKFYQDFKCRYTNDVRVVCRILVKYSDCLLLCKDYPRISFVPLVNIYA